MTQPLASVIQLEALADEVVVVTGAAGGIGAALASGLAAFGARVACLDLAEESVQSLADRINAGGGTAEAFAVDVTSQESCQAVAEAIRTDLGDVSILVNGAAMIRRITPDQPGFADAIGLHLRVNAEGSARMVEVLLPQLIRTHGRVVNFGSIASYLATPGGSGYGASKGAVMQLTRAMAMELAPHGVRVNAVAPGWIRTPLTEPVWSDPDRVEKIITHTPMGRFGHLDEIVGAVIFLGTELSSFVTGVTLPVDGGYLTV